MRNCAISWLCFVNENPSVQTTWKMKGWVTADGMVAVAKPCKGRIGGGRAR